MASVSTPLDDQARSIFESLGYTITDDGDEFRAERKWRSVRVRAVDQPTTLPHTGTLRCFVTYRSQASPLRERLLEAKPDYDWAVIGVDPADAADYTVFTGEQAADEAALA
jgi:hypothetical protein